MFRWLKNVLKPVAMAIGNLALKARIDARTPDGRRYQVPYSFNGVQYVALWLGKYENAEATVLRENFRPDHTIIEIGANIGIISRLALETKLQSGGKFVCFEPNTDSLSALWANIQRAQNFNIIQAEVVGAAVSGLSDDGKLLPFNTKPNLGSGLESVTLREAFDDVRNVPVRSLTSVVNTYAPNGYSLICDAEGAEYRFLEEDTDALASCRQIAIELHEKTSLQKPQNLVKILENLGFSEERVLGNTYYFVRTTPQSAYAVNATVPQQALVP